MTKFGFYAFWVAACFVTLAGDAFGEAGTTSRNYSINYNFTPSGTTTPLIGSETVSDVDEKILFLPSEMDTSYTLFAGGATSQSDYRSEVGSAVSFSIIYDEVEVDSLSLTSYVENTQRFYLLDDDGDGLDDIVIGVDTYQCGDLGVNNPYYTSVPFDVTFATGGSIEVGYRLSVTAASVGSWDSMGGSWTHEFVSQEQTMTFDPSSGNPGVEETAVDELIGETFETLKNSDVGKPFDVTISLETWLVGTNFSAAFGAGSSENDILLLFSDLQKELPTNKPCYADLVAGGSPSPVPEPGLASALLCLLVMGAWMRMRRRAR